MNIRRVITSTYALVSIVIVSVFVIIYFNRAIIPDDLETNLYSELFGVFLTAIILALLLASREWFVWRKTKKKVMKRIGRQIEGLFIEITDLCVIDFPVEAFKTKTYRVEELKSLLTKKIILRDSWKQKDRSITVAHRFESQWKAIGILDLRHGKHLNPEIQCSLLEIEDSLHKLMFKFYVIDYNEQDREEIIVAELKKVVTEIAYLRKNGIEIGF